MWPDRMLGSITAVHGLEGCYNTLRTAVQKPPSALVVKSRYSPCPAHGSRQLIAMRTCLTQREMRLGLSSSDGKVRETDDTQKGAQIATEADGLLQALVMSSYTLAA